MSDVAAAWRRRLELDAAALGLRLQLEQGAGEQELAALEGELARQAAARAVLVPTPAQLRALADEVEAWLELRQDADDTAVRWEQWTQTVSWPLTAAESRERRAELEVWVAAARDGLLQAEVGWLGGLVAEPADIAARIEETRAEVEAVADEVAQLELDEATRAEWLAWVDAFEAWLASEPSTFWGATITDLEEWDAQLAGHRRRLERAAQRRLETPSEPRTQAPAQSIVERASGAISEAASGVATGVGVVVGLVLLGGALYLVSKRT